MAEHDSQQADSEDDFESALDLGLGEVFALDEVDHDFDTMPEWCGRFRLVEEIARGGMGIVYRARDERLERDVAIKVIRRERIEESNAVSRFLEEAQIAGQLQHPGIVPIYDSGLDDHDQPFFCMKLIEGETLSSALKARGDLEANLGHLINVFGSICQTISFAHARGVIHRDLKPNNVMIGSFGEVQVLDWGFAKLIDSPQKQETKSAKPSRKRSLRTLRSQNSSSESVSGSVLGTPGYMAPEQARGEIDQIDERCDVFALGAILCEILTGKPPHYSEGQLTTAPIAAAADMSACYKRIAHCDGPEEMKLLATWCLNPMLEERPRNAFVVADAVAHYSDELESRRHQAQVEAKTAAQKLAQEKKARQLTLAASVVFLIGLALTSYWWWQRAEKRQTSRAVIGEDFREALETARVRSREKSWAAMDETLQRARQILKDELAPRKLRSELMLASAQFDRRRKRLNKQLQDREKRESLAKALSSVRQQPVDKPDAGTKEYAQAFANFGTDMTRMSANRALLEFDGLPEKLRDQVIAALDDWASREKLPKKRPLGRERPLERAQAALWRTLIGTAQLLDRDDWRRQLRQLAQTQDSEALLTISKERTLNNRDAQSLVLLATSLRRVDKIDDAHRVLWLGFLTHPNNFWINHHLAMIGLTLDRRKASSSPPATIDILRRAERHAWIALALEPDSAVARENLASILLRQNQMATAVEVIFERKKEAQTVLRRAMSRAFIESSPDKTLEFYRQATDAHPHLAQLWSDYARASLAVGDFSTTEKAARLGLKISPRNESLRGILAQSLSMRGKWPEAIALLEFEFAGQLSVRLREQIRRLQSMADSPRPLDLSIPGAAIDRARLLTLQGRSIEASRAWDHATRRGRPPLLGEGGRPPVRPRTQGRSIERDAMAALIGLAKKPNSNSQDQGALWAMALTIANRYLTQNYGNLSGHSPFHVLRESRLYLVDPRLASSRNFTKESELNPEQIAGWQAFWNKIGELAN